MSLTKLTTDLDYIQKLDDEPNDVSGLTAAQVKAEFDKAGNAIKTYINDTLTSEIDVLPATSISVEPIPTLAGIEVQTVLESIKARIDTIAVSNANAEVADTHVGADARTYTSLSQRLDTMDTFDTTVALQVDLDTTNTNVTTVTNDLNTLESEVYRKSDWSSGTNYIKFPNGQIHQWGTVVTPNTSIPTSNNMSYSVAIFNFPIPFTTGVLSMNGWQTSNVNCWVSVYGGTTKTGSSVYVIGNDVNVTKNKTIYWYAIGY